MRNHELNRRDFSKLTMAAFGGMLAGTAASAAAQEKESKKDSKKNPLLVEPHVCRGLNTCKGKGKGGDNACAGQGNCATVEAHSCKRRERLPWPGRLRHQARRERLQGHGRLLGPHGASGRLEEGAHGSSNSWPRQARRSVRHLRRSEIRRSCLGSSRSSRRVGHASPGA